MSAVVSAITSGKKCIEKLYPLKYIYRYTFERTPPFLEPTPQPEGRAGMGNERANHVPAAKAAVQVLPRKNKR